MLLIYHSPHLELDEDEVDGSNSGSNKDDLHGGIIEGNERSDQIQVTGDENKCKQTLTLPGDAGTRSRLPHLPQEEQNCKEMGDISDEAENVHGGGGACCFPGMLIVSVILRFTV